MDRERVVELLAGIDENWKLAREALKAGARFEFPAEPLSRRQLLAIYTRRERHVRRNSQPTRGFGEAVARLDDYDGAEVFLGTVHDQDRSGYLFQIVMDAGRGFVVACHGVKPPATTQTF